MKIELAQKAGFCGGVKRAIDMVYREWKNLPAPVYVYGNLVHNEDVMQDLKQKGVRVTDKVADVREGTVILTAHGTPQKLKDELQQNPRIRVLDTVCPKVSYLRQLVKDLQEQGRQVLVYGDRGHPEIVSLPGLDSGKVTVFSHLQEVNTAAGQKGCSYAVVAQTTSDGRDYDSICRELKHDLPDLEVYNTICPATSERQQEGRELAGRNDMILVVGSTTSANTNRLYQVCKRVNPNTNFIQNAGQLDPERHLGGSIDKVGITAGASTPDRLIKEVISKIKEQDPIYAIKEQDERGDSR